MQNKTSIFVMTAETACDVWDAFLMAEALSEQERVNILMKFVEEGRIKSLNVQATKEEVVLALQEHLKMLLIRRQK